MRKVLVHAFLTVLMSLVAVLSGCGVDLLVSTGIVTSLQSQDAKTALKAGKFADSQMALTTVQQAVNSFKASEGRNPTSLQELVNTGYLASVPEAPAGQVLYYDPATGNADFRSPSDVPPAPAPPPAYQPQKGYAQPQQLRPGQPPVPAHGPVAPANRGVRSAPVQQPSSPQPVYQGKYTPRGQIGSTTQQYNQQQQKAVDDLVGR